MFFNPRYREGHSLPGNADPLQLCHEELAAFEKERVTLARLDFELQCLKNRNQGLTLRNWVPRYFMHLQVRRFNVMRQMDSLLAQKMKPLDVEDPGKSDATMTLQ